MYKFREQQLNRLRRRASSLFHYVSLGIVNISREWKSLFHTKPIRKERYEKDHLTAHFLYICLHYRLHAIGDRAMGGYNFESTITVIFFMSKGLYPWAMSF